MKKERKTRERRKNAETNYVTVDHNEGLFSPRYIYIYIRPEYYLLRNTAVHLSYKYRILFVVMHNEADL